MQKLNITDILYGSFEITEPVILEIITSSEFQRLKYISNGGYYPAWTVLTREQFNRYYHSLGVFLLLRRFNASLEAESTKVCSIFISDKTNDCFPRLIL